MGWLQRLAGGVRYSTPQGWGGPISPPAASLLQAHFCAQRAEEVPQGLVHRLHRLHRLHHALPRVLGHAPNVDVPPNWVPLAGRGGDPRYDPRQAEEQPTQVPHEGLGVGQGLGAQPDGILIVPKPPPRQTDLTLEEVAGRKNTASINKLKLGVRSESNNLPHVFLLKFLRLPLLALFSVLLLPGAGVSERGASYRPTCSPKDTEVPKDLPIHAFRLLSPP